MYKHFFKRIIDFSIAFVALSVLVLPLIIVTLWLYFSNKGAGAFFFQERPGKDGKIFKIVKLKTMTDERDANGNLLPDEMRLTKVGKFVRSTSIDELPQFWNVLVGDMALIGPRPLLPRYLPWYTEEEKHRHDVRPGITGYAQCHGRNAVTWDEKLAMDVWYANHVSLNTDLKIIFKTIKSVLKRESVEVAGVEALDTYRKRKGK
ncbi:sugar transferase [Bacteroides sp.]|uniref:sugar transferase n=1 Tax=Bacteroides sp. TaxID=29523 RepID=UPI00258619AD|nr:sugar transferase [Bacteroides sp.]